MIFMNLLQNKEVINLVRIVEKTTHSTYFDL